MGVDKYRSHNEKMRSSLDKGDYRAAQREAGSFIGDLLSDTFNGIGSFFQNRREAKERERERQEQLRRKREATERRGKIIKTVFIALIIAGVGTGSFFLVKNLFFEKPSIAVEKMPDSIESEQVVVEEAAPETIETKETDLIDIDTVSKKNIFKATGDFLLKKAALVKIFFVNELFQKITGIPQSNNLLYIIGYGFIALWLGLGSIFILAFLGKTFTALFNKKNWSKAGNSLLSSFILVASDIILYFTFRGVLERQVTGMSFEDIVTLISFGLFIFANITVVVMLRAKNKKARFGTVIKMIALIAVIYIPIILLRGNA